MQAFNTRLLYIDSFFFYFYLLLFKTLTIVLKLFRHIDNTIVSTTVLQCISFTVSDIDKTNFIGWIELDNIITATVCHHKGNNYIDF